MRLILLQIPITWAMYKLGIMPIDTPDGIILFYLQLWNMEPLVEGKLSKNMSAIGKLLVSGLFSLLVYNILALTWTRLVNVTVPEPYLDEVFHIPQAQAYCKGRWDVWDDKITTPPGLYLIAVLYHKILGYTVCTAASLRHVNLVGIFFVHHLALLCRKYIERRPRPVRIIRGGENEKNSGVSRFMVIAEPALVSFFANHAAINITAFPVLFFFSGLFYTDVWSTVSVLLVYLVHLWRMTRTDLSVWGGLLVVVLGVASLLMRQTNVFWVAVYFGGLEAVHAVKCVRMRKDTFLAVPHQNPDLTSLVKQMWEDWSVGKIEDPPLSDSGPADWLFCCLSIAVAIAYNPLSVLGQIWPYVSIVGLFASFVGWNEGVVLGDKSNHVATLHLAQMLYIWPLFAFFSAPLFIPPVLSWASKLLKCRPAKPVVATKKPSASARMEYTPARRAFHFFFSKLFYPIFLLGTVVLSVAIVKYNTIIHPFTLADNRHYMFYIFRYTIRRSQMIRYALIPVYMIAANLVWSRLAGENKRMFSAESPTNLGDAPSAALIDLSDKRSNSSRSPATSTALLWLATTTLSLMTAPLVEPRYFILPWVFWRLLVPAWPTTYTPPARYGRVVGWLAGVSRRYDLSSFLETAWFLSINYVTFKVFLGKPYIWKAEDGTVLDGGRTQRFMW